MGVVSKPTEPRPPYFSGFLTYDKRKFVEKFETHVGALLWKISIFQFNTAMYMCPLILKVSSVSKLC